MQFLLSKIILTKYGSNKVNAFMSRVTHYKPGEYDLELLGLHEEYSRPRVQQNITEASARLAYLRWLSSFRALYPSEISCSIPRGEPFNVYLARRGSQAPPILTIAYQGDTVFIRDYQVKLDKGVGRIQLEDGDYLVCGNTTVEGTHEVKLHKKNPSGLHPYSALLGKSLSCQHLPNSAEGGAVRVAVGRDGIILEPNRCRLPKDHEMLVVALPAINTY